MQDYERMWPNVRDEIPQPKGGPTYFISNDYFYQEAKKKSNVSRVFQKCVCYWRSSVFANVRLLSSSWVPSLSSELLREFKSQPHDRRYANSVTSVDKIKRTGKIDNGQRYGEGGKANWWVEKSSPASLQSACFT